ncbi:diguanylate cyclase [Symbioplanes lichenis]|uniref:diguanylate cyclase n=1 Tax=Symbioplanes lichenis TaxID=1629072 RepID=UPI002738BE86|nr:diguanylate cyclase [Actinoplanes lichenis]
MTLRGRLTTAFLAVVLGPVLLGSFFVGLTVSTVSRDRTAERLDHAVTTVRAAIGAMCRQLQAVADAVAVSPADDHRVAADQMVARGLASEVRVSGSPPSEFRLGERDCTTLAAGGGRISGLVAQAVQGDTTVVALERVDAALVRRLGGTSGAEVRLGSGVSQAVARKKDVYERQLTMEPGQPLPLTVSVEDKQPTLLYISLAAGVAAVAGLAVAAARWLARSTTRPLEKLAWAAGKVASGELGVRVPVGRDDEIGQLAGTFNRMTRELQAYVQALTASRDQLRGHLAILGDTLSSTHDLHRILQVILQTALSATGARAGVVLLIDQAEGRLVARCAEGLTGRWDVPEEDLPSLRVPVGQGVLGAVAASGEPSRGVCGVGGGPVDEPVCRTYVAVPICAPAMVGDPLVPADTSLGADNSFGSDRPGHDSAGRDGVGRDGVGRDSAGRDGVGRDGVGRDSAGRDGVGRSGSEGQGSEHGGLGRGGPEGGGLEGGGEPVTLAGKPATLGVLALYDRLGADEFDDADLLTLRTFAGQAGVAVHNVRVHEEAQRLSLTDPLTGLWNYRYLRESLRREVERASRFGRMLTVLVLDLDHFKQVNDTYGHAAGDVVLGEFARRIRAGLREVDVAFRQGGEEFVVLLPETDAFGGVIVAERLGAAVRDLPVRIDPRRVEVGVDPRRGRAEGERSPREGTVVDRVRISVSIGIAVYPEHGHTAQQVLDAADDALYAAKAAGRDTYRLAEAVPLPAGGVTDPLVSEGVPEGHFDHQGSTSGASGGPQPPRQARGR